MSDTIISVENLGKKYVLSHQGERGGYRRFSEKLENWMKKPFAALARGSGVKGLRGQGSLDGGSPSSISHLPSTASKEEFWALKDVSFEVKRGEVVGIIGRNGAGKSTLLKILSRITEPTEGRVTLRGRVASLLEVGTGFHPELTGRENIFLNGAILGMTKAEIKKKFDEIVAFAEVERFLDTPVKRYSSGMYVRLAFAVAAHLEPEILVVDEVLAVGDAEFQKKCLGKMKDVATDGRTVLFVSHNMAAVQNLCGLGLVLKMGEIVFNGDIDRAVSHYVNSYGISNQAVEKKILSMGLTLKSLNAVPAIIRCNDSIKFELELEAREEELITDLMLEIYSIRGQLAGVIDFRSETGPYRLKTGEVLKISSQVRNMPFVETDFSLALYVNSKTACRSYGNLLSFSVLPSDQCSKVVPREPRFRGMVELNKVVEHLILSSK